MSEITQDRLDRIVETADEILSALAGKNEDVHPDDSKKMCQLWDELNDSLAPPEVVKSIVLELSELRKEREAAVPVDELGHVRREVHVGGNTWVQCSAQAYERAKAEGKITRELYEPPAQPVAVPVVPDGLRIALSNAGIAAPESDEMLAATCEKHIQELVGWVKDRKPFQTAQVAMKDHQIRELVNELRDIAVEYHGTQQLRERIARTVRAAMLAAPGKEG
ncbi:hypothetical protein SM003_004179 [Cronobacter malonaticus]|nr:hypothetical protein [Cronobacter malonaticus]